MKAVRFHAHGGPEVLVYEDAPDPVVPAGWVGVGVGACALNRLDLWQRKGLERVTIPMPHTSGADVAGVIDEVGSGVTGLATGTPVMVQPGLSCGRCRFCLDGRDNRCPRYDVLGYQSAGGYAARVAVPAENVFPMPEGVDVVRAAAFPLTFLTAWHMLFTHAALTERDTVLVVAAGSGVGQAAIQIVKWRGGRVIATAGGAAKIEKARALGADDVIDHYTEDVVRRVREITQRSGVDIVVEHVGAATWERSVRCLGRGGRLVICGATTGHDVALDLRHLFARQLSLVGSYMGTKAELIRAADLFFKGVFDPAVDRVFPLAEAADAHRHLESGRAFGKVALAV